MREIKFRGLRVDGKGWVYGSLTCKHSVSRYWIGEFAFGSYYHTMVIPESVGQLTGLQDKWGVDIYEGDKVSCKGHDCIITYRNNFCDYTMDMIKYGGRLLNLTKANVTSHGIEVIGNIHESKI